MESAGWKNGEERTILDPSRYTLYVVCYSKIKEFLRYLSFSWELNCQLRGNGLVIGDSAKQAGETRADSWGDFSGSLQARVESLVSWLRDVLSSPDRRESERTRVANTRTRREDETANPLKASSRTDSPRRTDAASMHALNARGRRCNSQRCCNGALTRVARCFRLALVRLAFATFKRLTVNVPRGISFHHRKQAVIESTSCAPPPPPRESHFSR